MTQSYRWPRGPWSLQAALLLGAACATTPQAVPPREAPVPTAEAPAPTPTPEVKPPSEIAQAPTIAPAPERQPAPAPPPAPPKEKPDDQLLSEALAALDAGELTTAEEGLRKLVEKAPRSANARFDLGLVLERQGKRKEAQDSYEEALKRDAGHVPARLRLGSLYVRQGKLAEATALYEAGLRVKGREQEASLRVALATALRLSNKLTPAEALCKRVLARNPEDVDARRTLGLIYYALGRYRLAELVILEALEQAGNDAGLHADLGMVALKLGERARAMSELRKAVALDDACVSCQHSLGAVALSWKDYADAERAFKRVVELEPDSADAWRHLARALDGQRGRDGSKGLAAGEAYEKVLALKPQDAEAVCGAGWAYTAERGGWDKAQGYLEKCKTLASTPVAKRQEIDVKLKSMAALRQSATPSGEEQAGGQVGSEGQGGSGGQGGSEGQGDSGGQGGSASPGGGVQ